MRVLLVSGELIGSALCHGLLRQGHEVKLYIENDGWKRCLDGIIPKVDDWKTELEWVGNDGLIIFDDVAFGEEQDRLRKEGYRVVGGSLEADRLELNRAHFHEVLREYGINVLPSFDFSTTQEAIVHIKSNPDYWVVKQNSHFGVLNHVGELADGSDAIALLEGYGGSNISVHLQKRTVGVEVGVARYFNGIDWVGPIEVNHEHKRMCNDDIGPLTPEMGTIMWFSEDDTLPLFTNTLAKLKPFLQEVKFKGDFDINCIVDEHHIWPLEATARFGAPSTELQSEMLETPWFDLLSAVADGVEYKPIFKDGYGIAVCIAVPPFPLVKNATDNSIFCQATPLFFASNLTEEEKEHIHFEEISKQSVTNTDGECNDVLYWAGTNGWTMHITAQGEDIVTARDKVYSIIEKIVMPKKFYRTDIGLRVAQNDLPNLKRWGWV